MYLLLVYFQGSESKLALFLDILMSYQRTCETLNISLYIKELIQGSGVESHAARALNRTTAALRPRETPAGKILGLTSLGVRD